jgi:hypothetical protein
LYVEQERTIVDGMSASAADACVRAHLFGALTSAKPARRNGALPQRAVAREWMECYAAEHPALAATLEDGALHQRAEQVTLLWKRANEQRVVQLRRADGIRVQMSASHVHRTLTGVLRAFTTKHEARCCICYTLAPVSSCCTVQLLMPPPTNPVRQTFATFLSEPLDGLQRWQMFMIIVTLVVSQLLVNIWMFYARVRIRQ